MASNDPSNTDVPFDTNWIPSSTRTHLALDDVQHLNINTNDVDDHHHGPSIPMTPMDELILEDNPSHPVTTDQRKMSIDHPTMSRFTVHDRSIDVPARVHGVTWTVTEPEQARIMMVEGNHRRWWQYTWEKRLLLRAIGLLSAINTVGFLGGASPYSSYDIPFSSSWFITVTLVAAILTIVLNLLYLVHTFRIIRSSQLNMDRKGRLWIVNWRTRDALVALMDVVMTATWMAGLVGIYQHKCSPGSLNGWCDFYNTSILFGTISLVIQLIVTTWEVHREVLFWWSSKHNKHI
ncbi:hypothetical protein BDF22DRAFT_744715 [Syncephalis plumigaleata]|nr:hypothetical protein BDF22DRAFT_744715 [Syncephalis plumigaleata]